MEKSKYLDPKSSQSVNELIRFMQLYQNNLSVKTNDNQSQALSEQVPIIEHIPSQAEATAEKKKNIYWVEKNPNEESKQIVEENGTNVTVNN